MITEYKIFENYQNKLSRDIYKYIWNNNGRLTHLDIMIKFTIGLKETLNILEYLTEKKLIYKLGVEYYVISTRKWQKINKNQ